MENKIIIVDATQPSMQEIREIANESLEMILADNPQLTIPLKPYPIEVIKDIGPFKDGKQRRRERRAAERKNKKR